MYEVAIPSTGKRWKSRESPPFRDAIALLDTSTLVLAWDRCAKVDNVSMRAARWAELRDMPGDWIRVLNGDEIVVRPVTAYDAELVAACKDGGWTRSRYVVGKVIAENALGFGLLRWRLQELLRAHVLEGRGDLDPLGFPAEVRPVARD